MCALSVDTGRRRSRVAVLARVAREREQQQRDAITSRSRDALGEQQPSPSVVWSRVSVARTSPCDRMLNPTASARAPERNAAAAATNREMVMRVTRASDPTRLHSDIFSQSRRST